MLERILLGYGGDDADCDGAVLAAPLASLCEAELSVAFPYRPLLASTTAEVAERRVREELEALTDAPFGAGSLEPTPPGRSAPCTSWPPSKAPL
jgi:hypothetical protein